MKSKKQNKRGLVPKAKKYEAHYLAIVLMAILLIEGVLIGSTSKMNWLYGVQILDVSPAVSETMSDIAGMVQPMADTADAVNQFYIASATQLTPILDMTEQVSDLEIVLDGINEFYSQAATQMTKLLEVSSMAGWPDMVAEASSEVK